MRQTIDKDAILLDALSRLVAGSSKTTLRQMLAAGRVRVNGAVEKNAKRGLRAGDVVDLAKKEHHALLPPDIALLY
ncbi:MAG TPA: S4 domain-containing protein, partial [Thermoanaerobaculia bacterium]|nr:S4 domain-containing protein [Thermoanaerobaculia bacterium]